MTKISSNVATQNASSNTTGSKSNSKTGSGSSKSSTATSQAQQGAGMAGMASNGETSEYGIKMNMLMPKAPASNDPRFVAGSTGPTVPKGDAPTLVIPDGPGFHGEKGRQQNAGDKEQDNYSVTDANFNPDLGLLAKNPDTGQPMTYDEDIQTYSAAGYIQTYAPDVYAKLVANQDAGKGTVLGAAAHIMGLVNTADPAEDGVDASSVPMTVPGTNLSAKQQVADLQDGTGQDWARPHHAESHWQVFANLISEGVDVQHAQEFSGDNAISGAGRINGVNNQDGASGLNAGELKVYQDAAAYEQQTGKPVILTMMMGHHMDDLDPSALTDPNINKQIGLPADDRDATPERAQAIMQGLLDGAVHNNPDTGGHNDGPSTPETPVPASAATPAGTGTIVPQTTAADEAALGGPDATDPTTALDSIAQQGFADGVTGQSSQQLSLLLQDLLEKIAEDLDPSDDTDAKKVAKQLTPAVLQKLAGLLPQLEASTDPAVAAFGKGLDQLLGYIQQNGGVIDQKAADAFTKLTLALGAASGNLDPTLKGTLKDAGIDATDPFGLQKPADGGDAPGLDLGLPKDAKYDPTADGADFANAHAADTDATATGDDAADPTADGTDATGGGSTAGTDKDADATDDSTASTTTGQPSTISMISSALQAAGTTSSSYSMPMSSSNTGDADGTAATPSAPTSGDSMAGMSGMDMAGMSM